MDNLKKRINLLYGKMPKCEDCPYKKESEVDTSELKAKILKELLGEETS